MFGCNLLVGSATVSTQEPAEAMNDLEYTLFGDASPHHWAIGDRYFYMLMAPGVFDG